MTGRGVWTSDAIRAAEELGRRVEYTGIVRIDTAAKGALRLYRRRWLVPWMVAYHPPGEWSAVVWTRDGRAEVTLP
jgi:hypothetical protein